MWEPPKTVGDQEVIARRLFRRQPLKGAKDQPIPDDACELYHFEDNRTPGSISMDRLGATGVNKAIVRVLQPKALEHSGIINKSFDGWRYVTAKSIRSCHTTHTKLDVSASPIETGKDHEINPFHADAIYWETEGYNSPPELKTSFLAHKLHTIFQRGSKLSAND